MGVGTSCLVEYDNSSCFATSGLSDANRHSVRSEDQMPGIPSNADWEDTVVTSMQTDTVVDKHIEIFSDCPQPAAQKRKPDALESVPSSESMARMLRKEGEDTVGELPRSPMPHSDIFLSKDTSIPDDRDGDSLSGVPSPCESIGRHRISFGSQDIVEIPGAQGGLGSDSLKPAASLGLHGVLDWLAKGGGGGGNTGKPELKKQGSGETTNSHRSQVSSFSVFSAKSKTTQALKDNDQCEWWMSHSETPNQFHHDPSGASSHLADSWCGTAPVDPEESRTPFRDRGVFGFFREYTAGQRHRYQWGGYDLDLAYVTSRVIAMGFPGQGPTAAFRNPLSEVRRFLRDKHGDDFRIYNLCIEKSHSYNGFPEHTVRFPCADHAPPTFSSIYDFCANVEAYLQEKAENVVAVHCKAGKGRTGTMICSLLVFSAAVKSAYDALRWYELTRGGFRSGVTIPAQIRWVAMFERWMRKKATGLRHDPGAAAAVPHRMQSLRLGPFYSETLGFEVGASRSSSSVVVVRVGLASREDNNVRKVSFWYPEFVYECDDNCMIDITLPQDGPVWRDHDGRLLIRIKQKKRCCSGKTKTLKIACWWHTAFLQSDSSQLPLSVGILDIGKVWVDGLQKDSSMHKKTPEEFRLLVTFLDVE